MPTRVVKDVRHQGQAIVHAGDTGGVASVARMPVSLVALQTNGAAKHNRDTSGVDQSFSAGSVAPDVLHCTFAHLDQSLHEARGRAEATNSVLRMRRDERGGGGGGGGDSANLHTNVNTHQAKISTNAGKPITFTTDDSLATLLAKHGDSRDRNRFALMMDTPQKYVQDAILGRHPHTIGATGRLAERILAGNATITDYLAAPKQERGSPLKTFLQALIGEPTLGGNTVKKARIITKIRILASQFTVVSDPTGVACSGVVVWGIVRCSFSCVQLLLSLFAHSRTRMHTHARPFIYGCCGTGVFIHPFTQPTNQLTDQHMFGSGVLLPIGAWYTPF